MQALAGGLCRWWDHERPPPFSGAARLARRASDSSRLSRGARSRRRPTPDGTAERLSARDVMGLESFLFYFQIYNKTSL